jgi:hypothetical protein
MEGIKTQLATMSDDVRKRMSEVLDMSKITPNAEEFKKRMTELLKSAPELGAALKKALSLEGLDFSKINELAKTLKTLEGTFGVVKNNMQVSGNNMLKGVLGAISQGKKSAEGFVNEVGAKAPQSVQVLTTTVQKGVADVHGALQGYLAKLTDNGQKVQATFESLGLSTRDSAEMVKTVMQDMESAGGQMASNLSGTFKGVFDDGIKGDMKKAGEHFTQFGQQVGQMLEKMLFDWLAKMAVMKLATAFLGPLPGLTEFFVDKKADGGVFAGPFLPFKAAADGAVFNQPTLGLIGEGRYPEAVIPMPNGQSIPVQFQGRGAQSPQPVNVTLQLNGRELGNVLFDMSQTGHLKLDTNVLMTNGRI